MSNIIGNNRLQNNWTNPNENRILNKTESMPAQMQSVIHSTDDLMYTYYPLNHLFNWERKLIQLGKIRGLLCAQGTNCTGQGESSWLSPLRLDGSRDDQTREAGPCYRRPRVSNYSSEVIRIKSTKIRWFSYGQAWGWTGYIALAQGLYSLRLKPRGTIRLKSTQIRWFSW